MLRLWTEWPNWPFVCIDLGRWKTILSYIKRRNIKWCGLRSCIHEFHRAESFPEMALKPTTGPRLTTVLVKHCTPGKP